MSVMGSISKFMSGIGIEDVWATVYAKNSIPQMLAGKSYTRAVRAHLFTQTILLEMVLKQVFQSSTTNALRKEVIELCLKVYRGNEQAAAAEESQSLVNILGEPDTILNILETSSRTSRLWVQYNRHVEIMRILIRAERLGDWTHHLHALKRFLPYFHAA
jgi:hypothetical protein